MPAHKYDILLRAQIVLGGTFEANTAAEAANAALLRLRKDGVLEDVQVERQMLADDDEDYQAGTYASGKQQ